MKKKLNIISTLLLLIVLGSCIKDKFPADKLDPGSYFKTEQDLELYVNSFYDQLAEGEEVFMKDGILSDYFAVSTSPSLLIYGSYTSQEYELEQWWQWDDLRNINFFLENNNNPDLSSQIKDRYNGIARFFRALFYYEKVKTFGDVPWYDKTLSTSDPDLYKKRDSRVYVIDKIIEDLDFAIAHLSSVKSSNSTTITKWTALALKSRISLFEGTYRKYSGSSELNSDYEDLLVAAYNSASMLVNESGYGLNTSGNTPYRDLFTSESPKTGEVILADAYSSSLARFHNANWLYTSSSTGARPGLTKTFINTFLNLDGSRFTDNSNYDQMFFTEEVQGRDRRLSQIIRTPGYRLLGSSVPPDFGHTKTGYHFIKYTQDDNANLAMARNTNTLPLIRFAEVLLNYAEAAAELGQMSDDIWNATIAALRERAGIEDLSRPQTADPYMMELYPGIFDADLLEIRRERAIELVGEGFRFDDLRRWRAGHLLEKEWDGIYVPATGTLYDMNGDGILDVSFVEERPDNPLPGVFYYILSPANMLDNGASGKILVYGNISKNFSDKKYLYPIPESQIIINTNLSQNNGWN
jgi:starch-binding outer membrane protein, SusD/RagB family